MNKVLITGSTGFIGRNLKENLISRFNIICPTHQELDLLNENNVFRFIKENSIDIVIHAALWNPNKENDNYPPVMLNNNLRMFFNLARCNQYYKKMIYYGSGAEYSREHWTKNMKEEYFDDFVPKDQYSYSKYIMAKYTEKSDNIYNLRLFGVFGKYENWKRRFISNTICRIIFDLPIKIMHNAHLDYTYETDIVKITEMFINREPKYKTFNVCTGVAYNFKTLAEKIIAISNKKININILDDKSNKVYSGDNSRLLKEIDNYKFIDIDFAIHNLYNWYLDKKVLINRKELISVP